MRLFDQDSGQRWLFCMTHPDDEIAISVWIKRLTSAGADVFMSWTHSTPEREAEARAAARILGVHEGNLFFHQAPDGDVVNCIWDLITAFREMMALVRPNRVVCAAFEQGHLDHDATNFVVNHSFEGPILEIPLYHTYTTRLQKINRFTSGEGEEVLELTPLEQEFKLQVAKSYPSQNIWSVLLWYEIYRAVTLRPVRLRRTERMRMQAHRSFLRPNLPDGLCERVRTSAQWQRWIAAVGPIALELAQDRDTLVEHGQALLS